MDKKKIYMHVALAAALLPVWTGELAAQPGARYDGINSVLTHPGNFIYFGKYKHAKEYDKNPDNTVKLINGSFHVTQHEASSTPILWHIMSRENNAAVLMSQYVVDTMIFASPSQKWNSSRVNSWLNNSVTGFASNFTALEQNLVSTGTIHAPAYIVQSGGLASYTYDSPLNMNSNTTSSTGQFYLPWGTPHLNPDNATSNNVFWDMAKADGSVPASDTALIEKTAALKGNPANPVYYWLRSMRGGISDYTMLVKPDGNVDVAPSGVSMGIRPMFRLDTARIIFAAELMDHTELERYDQEIADNSDRYRDGIALGIETGNSNAKVFKLTVCDNSPAPDNLPYDYDETLAEGGTVAVKPGDTLRIGHGSTVVAGYDSAAYKLVRDESGSREIQRRGFTSIGNASLIEIVARNIFTEYVWSNATQSVSAANPDAGVLRGNCDAYIWLQKNNPDNSHSGSETMHFNLHIIDDNTAPVVSQVGKIIRRPAAGNSNIADSAFITLRIQEDNGGKYYYMVDPAVPPASVADFIGGAAFMSSGKKTFATGSPLIVDTLTGFVDNAPHTFYMLAKDSVRNTGQILQITIPEYMPNRKPDSIPYFTYIEPNRTTTIPVSAFASDPDVGHFGDALKITSIDTPPDASIASAAIVMPDADALRITGVDAGDTAVHVTVKDDSYDSTKCRIAIAVRYAPSVAIIDFIDETLTGLDPGRYLFTCDDEVTDTVVNNWIDIDAKWFGATIAITRISPVTGAPVTTTQQLTIPQRPAPPVVQPYNESFDGYIDGRIEHVNDSMEYSVDTTAIAWIAIRAGKTTLADLHPGVYLVRYKAIAGKRFVSRPVEVTIERGVASPQINREIVLPALDGVTTVPAAGSHRVIAPASFAFSVTFSGAQLKVKTSRDAGGEQEELTGTPNLDGGFDYIIRRITTSPVVVTIGPETVANDTPDATSGDLAVWTHRGAVCIQTKRPATVSIYTLAGTLAAQVRTAEGYTATAALPAGVYIVATSSGARVKTAVR